MNVLDRRRPALGLLAARAHPELMAFSCECSDTGSGGDEH